MYESLQQELTSQILQPPANDQRIAAFCQALLHILKAPQDHVVLLDIIGRMAPASPSYRVNHLLRAFQRQLLDTNPAYPREFISPETWEEGIISVLSSARGMKLLRSDLLERSVQSNVVERYKAVKLVMGLAEPLLSDAPSMLDVGCSRNLGLKKIKLNLPFTPVKCAVSAFGELPSVLLDRLFNENLSHALQLGDCVGMDIIPLSVGVDAAWAKSCSFYPSELLQERAVAEYDYLDKLELRGVEFMEHDVTQPMLAGVTQKFDVMMLSTFLYQLDDTSRTAVRDNLRRHLNDNGIIIYQDFSHTNASSSSLEFEKHWFENLYPYRTIIEFADRESPQLYEVFRWNNGRCEQWLPGKDLATVLARLSE